MSSAMCPTRSPLWCGRTIAGASRSDLSTEEERSPTAGAEELIAAPVRSRPWEEGRRRRRERPRERQRERARRKQQQQQLRRRKEASAAAVAVSVAAVLRSICSRLLRCRRCRLWPGPRAPRRQRQSAEEAEEAEVEGGCEERGTSFFFFNQLGIRSCRRRGQAPKPRMMLPRRRHDNGLCSPRKRRERIARLATLRETAVLTNPPSPPSARSSSAIVFDWFVLFFFRYLPFSTALLLFLCFFSRRDLRRQRELCSRRRKREVEQESGSRPLP